MQKDIPWSIISNEYRCGQLSIRAIAKEHNISETAIRKRARSENWSRDLSGRVREKVRSSLVRSEVRTPNASEEIIIEEAAERAVALVRSHRRDIAKLQAIEQRFLDELSDEENPPTKVHLSSYQGKVTQTVLDIAVTERAAALQALANVQHKRIQLDRQAFNLDEVDRTTAKMLIELD